jgi:hypothetical protein
VAELFQQIAQVVGDVIDPAGISLRSRGHLPGNQQIDLTPVVFIVGEAFVNLRSGQLREAVCRHRIDSLAILKQADGQWLTNTCGGGDRISQMVGGPYTDGDTEAKDKSRDLTSNELHELFSKHRVTIRW